LSLDNLIFLYYGVYMIEQNEEKCRAYKSGDIVKIDWSEADTVGIEYFLLLKLKLSSHGHSYWSAMNLANGKTEDIRYNDRYWKGLEC
jgi:hypothetical protein